MMDHLTPPKLSSICLSLLTSSVMRDLYAIKDSGGVLFRRDCLEVMRDSLSLIDGGEVPIERLEGLAFRDLPQFSTLLQILEGSETGYTQPRQVREVVERVLNPEHSNQRRLRYVEEALDFFGVLLSRSYRNARSQECYIPKGIRAWLDSQEKQAMAS